MKVTRAALVKNSPMSFRTGLLRVSMAAPQRVDSVTQEVRVNTEAPEMPAPTAQPPASMPPKPISSAPMM